MADRATTSQTADDDRFVELVLRLLDDDLHDASLGSELNALLLDDASRQRQFVALCLHARLLATRLGPELATLSLRRDAADAERENEHGLLWEVVEAERAARAAAAREAQIRERVRREEDQSPINIALRRGRPSELSPVRHIVIPRGLVYAVAGAIGAMAAALVLMVAQSFLSGPSQPVPSPIVQTPSAPEPTVLPQPVARIIASVDAHWEGASDRRRLPIPAHEPLILRHGMAKLRFETGAEVILNAPVEVVPISAGELRLVRGELVGRCLSDSARGFTVQTDSARIVDLGTEFGVRITDTDATEAHVFDGEIMLTAMSGGSERVTLSLKRGMAGRVNHEGTRIIETTASHAFVTDAEFETHVMAREGSTYHRALAHRYAMMRDADLLAFYTFERETIRDGVVLNQALATRGRLDAVLKGSQPNAQPRTASARFAGEQALDFMPSGSETAWAEVEHDPAFDTLEEITLAAWIQRSPHDGGTIISKREADTAVSFQMALFGPTRGGGHRNVMQFGSGDGDTTGDIFHHSASITRPLDGWRFVVATYKDGEVKLYLDGRLIDRGRMAGCIRRSRAPLLIGAAPMTLARSKADPFQGSIDEIAIFSRALTEAEIAVMYEASAP